MPRFGVPRTLSFLLDFTVGMLAIASLLAPQHQLRLEPKGDGSPSLHIQLSDWTLFARQIPHQATHPVARWNNSGQGQTLHSTHIYLADDVPRARPDAVWDVNPTKLTSFIDGAMSSDEIELLRMRIAASNAGGVSDQAADGRLPDSALGIDAVDQRGSFDSQTGWIGAGMALSTMLLAVLGAIAFGLARRRVSAPERSHAETLDALSRARDQLARVQEIGRIGSWEVSYPEERVEWSDQVLEILGVDRGEMGNTVGDFLDRVHPEDREDIRRKRDQWIARGGIFEMEYRIVRPDGSIRWVHGRVGMSRNADGSPRRSSGTIQDISDTRRQEQSLWQFRSLLEGSEDLCGIVDGQGRYQWANTAYAQAYGVKADELPGCYAGDVVGNEYFNTLVRPYFEAALDGQAQSYETTRELASGERRRLLARYYPIDPPGDFERRVGFVITDITEIHQAEMRLAEQAGLIGIAGRVARIGGWSVDLDQGTQSWSDVVAEIHGMPHGFAPSIEEGIAFYAPEDRGRIRDLWTACVEAGQPYDVELQIVDADEQRHWVRAVGEPVRDETGRIVRIQGAFQDITSRMQIGLERKELSARLATLIDKLSDGFVALDEDWRYVLVNPAAESIGGKAAEELLGSAIWDQFPIAGTPIGAALRRAMDERRPGAAELFFEPMGRWFDVRAYPWEKGIAIFFRDISDHHRMLNDLREQETDLRRSEVRLNAELETRGQLINSLPAHIAMLDEEGNVLEVNQRWQQYGASGGNSDPDFGVGTNYIAVCESATEDCAEGAKEVARGLREVLSGAADHFELEYPCHGPDRRQWFRAVFNRLADHRGGSTGVVVMHVDITELVLASKELERIVYEDSLTRTLTRKGFERDLEALIDGEGWTPKAVLMVMDVEGMRDVNEAHGYDIGDRLLVALSERLREKVGDDGLVGRIAGDEFAVYLMLHPEKPVEEQLETLMASITERFEVTGNSIEIDFGAGYTMLGDHRRTSQALLQEAELALFENRSDEHFHRRWIAYSQSVRKRAHEQIKLTTELRRALEEEQFELHFQPKVYLRDGRLAAAEALVRWRHPDRGLQPPGTFIPVAEQSQLIGPIGIWVVRAACRHLRDWQADGLDLVQVSVNVSLVQFLIGDFTAEVERALQDFGVRPESLLLEITESVFERHSERLLATMKKLHRIGVQLSLDDFGTGYSSLRYLQQYPFDEVKIDQAFVAGVTTDDYSRNIIRSVLSVSDAIHARTVAEGIESREAVDALLELGCDIGQGYFFSLPLEAEDFRWLLQSSSCLPLELE